VSRWYAVHVGLVVGLLGMSGDGSAGLFEGLAEQAAPARAGGRPRLRQAERDQVLLRAISLDALLPADHRARLVWAFVERLDLSSLLDAIRAVEGHAGHPPADPRILLALWLHATVEGIGSARALARLCEEHLAYQWLCGGVGMNHKTLGDFRVGHGALLERLLVDGVAALLASGAVTLARVAQDGVRVRAGAGAASFRRRSTLAECRRLAAAEVARLADIVLLEQAGCAVHAPPPKPRDAARDRYAPRAGDPPEIAA